MNRKHRKTDLNHRFLRKANLLAKNAFQGEKTSISPFSLSQKGLFSQNECVSFLPSSSSSIKLNRLERLAPRESESVHETLSFRHTCEKMRIFDSLRPIESNGARVGFIEFVKLYLAPSTRVAGSVCGRIVLRNTRI